MRIKLIGSRLRGGEGGVPFMLFFHHLICHRGQINVFVLVLYCIFVFVFVLLGTGLHLLPIQISHTPNTERSKSHITQTQAPSQANHNIPSACDGILGKTTYYTSNNNMECDASGCHGEKVIANDLHVVDSLKAQQ